MMRVQFIDYPALVSLHEADEDETPVLEQLLNHANEFISRQLNDPHFRRSRQGGKWANRTIYLLPIGVRSAKESTLAQTIIGYRDLVPTRYRMNLISPVLFLLSENTMHDWDAHRAVKGRQFYLQTATSYGLGKVVPYSDLNEFLLQLLDLILSESVNEEGDKDPCDVELFGQPIKWSPGDLSGHIARVYRTFCGGLNSLFRLQHDPESQKRAYHSFNMEKFVRDPQNAALNKTDQLEFLRLLSIAYHVGRYRRAQFHAARVLSKFDGKIGSTKLLKELRSELIEEFRRKTLGFDVSAHSDKFSEHHPPTPEQSELSSGPMTTYGRLRVYYLLRDCARALASAAPTWTSGKQSNIKRRILLIDDNYRADVNWRLTILRESLWENNAEIDIAKPGIWVEFSTWFETNWGNQVRTWVPEESQLMVERMPTFPYSADRAPTSISQYPLLLSSYDVILLDAEVEGRDRGPELVFWLDAVYRNECQQNTNLKTTTNETSIRRGGVVRDPETLSLPKPRLLVLTDARPTESLQQCLNLGVETYVSKDRIFDLPFAIMQVSESFGVRKDLVSAQDFPSVQNLPLRTLDVLRNESRGLISGNALHYVDRRWIKKLPKSDLHYHIGTSITLESISAMAFNTMGYLLDRGSGEANGPRAFLDETISSICTLVHMMVRAAMNPINGGDANENDMPKWDRPEAYEWAEILWRVHASPGKLDKGGDVPADVFDKLIKSIHKQYKPIEAFEVTSVLVAAISYWEERIHSNGAETSQKDCAWNDRLEWIGWLDRHPDDSMSVSFRSTLSPALEEWTGIYTRDAVRNTFVDTSDHFASTDEQCRPFWGAVETHVRSRALKAWAELGRQYERLARAHGGIGQPKEPHRRLYLLQNLVAAPEGVGAQKSLPLYLRGAGLLGADHLQFPENILLAALDITKQNVEDNVWYSELRCSTNGYCKAGLSPFSATDILCRSFDLAAHHWANVFNNRWVLVNILLGAKRHKPDEIPEVVSLMKSYLQRNVEKGESIRPQTAPSWWRPSKVIGFDLSGNEAQEKRSIDGLQVMMKQLLAECAQITIHAGEAASAENIWDAIYRLGARRIGHGLRLREHSRLRDHAMRLGICMELCPTSNALTNDFVRSTFRGREKAGRLGEHYDPSFRWHYPLLTYVDANMQVCINTDNRFLHRHCHALTDEYLEAARMVGGLTRLQILRLVRVGFTTAFLDHKQKSEILKHVDEVVYRLLSEQDEEVHGPNGS